MILLADSSKVNRSGYLYGMELNRIHMLVTDEDTPLDLRDSLRDAIRRLIICKTDARDESDEI